MSVTWHGMTITLDIGLASLPSVAIGSTTWTDVSAYLRDIPSIHRGRNSETDRFETGSMTVVLDNRDRRFDPNYAAGPYFGNLLPMRRVRLRFVYNAVTYAVWHGFVRGWPQEYHTSNKDAWVSLQCDDGFSVLNRQALPDSVYAYQIGLDSPVGWWRLGETSGTSALDSSTGGRNGTYSGSPTATSGLIFGSGNGAVTFDGVDDIMLAASPVSAFPVTIEMWMATTTTTTGYYMNVPVGTSQCWFEVRADGKVRANVSPNGSGAALFFTGSATSVNTGVAFHIAATYASAGASPTLYVNGVSESAASGSLGVADDSNTQIAIGGEAAGVNLTNSTIDEVAVYSSALSAGTILAHYGYGTTPWNGDLTGARIGRLLDVVAWPSADRTVATGNSTLQSATLDSDAVLNALQECELSEFGQVFMGADGTVIFRDRHWRSTDSHAITSQATFGDDGTGSELPYVQIVSDDGQQLIYNRVRFTRDGGTVIDRPDPTSIGKFYERTRDVSGFLNDDDDDVIDFANWYLATHKDPIQRVAALTIYPRRDVTNLIPAVLGLDIGYRVTVKRRPQNVSTALSYTLLVEGINHQISRDGSWAVTFYMSAADSLTGLQPLIFDDATYGLFDTGVFAA